MFHKRDDNRNDDGDNNNNSSNDSNNNNDNNNNCLWSRSIVWKIASENAQNIVKLQELAQRVLEESESTL